jgi:hypothetical protein
MQSLKDDASLKAEHEGQRFCPDRIRDMTIS